MKHIKLLTGLASLSILTTSITPIVSSCNTGTKDNTDENQYTKYIADRTFSIFGKGYANVFGTAWILGDATPDNLTDYKYYLATNMHVIHSFYEYGCSTIYYGDKSMADSYGYISPGKYKQFFDQQSLLTQIKLIDINDIDNDFQYESVSSSTYFKPFIDFAILEVNFGTVLDTNIKNKLDNLNAFQKQNGYINKFVTINDNSPIHSTNKHIGGYPFDDNQRETKWECHNLSASEFTYYKLNTKTHTIGYPDKDPQGRTIEGGVEKYYRYDISPQYYCKANKKESFMSGGASGSLMIDDDFNSIGIYWGGWSDSSNNYHPAFSLFNTTNKNFVEGY